jgi:hypothetical protein
VKSERHMTRDIYYLVYRQYIDNKYLLSCVSSRDESGL